MSEKNISKKCDCGSCFICNGKRDDTYSYRGWLQSDHLIKRSFAVAGHFYLAYFLIAVPLLFLTCLAIFFMMGVTSRVNYNYNDNNYGQNRMRGYDRVMQNEDSLNNWYDNSTRSNNMPTYGKLDINYICTDAAKSLSSQDGQSKFIQDCVAGKYPEVIDTFKANNNLNGATI